MGKYCLVKKSNPSSSDEDNHYESNAEAIHLKSTLYNMAMSDDNKMDSFKRVFSPTSSSGLNLTLNGGHITSPSSFQSFQAAVASVSGLSGFKIDDILSSSTKHSYNSKSALSNNKNLINNFSDDKYTSSSSASSVSSVSSSASSSYCSPSASATSSAPLPPPPPPPPFLHSNSLNIENLLSNCFPQQLTNEFLLNHHVNKFHLASNPFFSAASISNNQFGQNFFDVANNPMLSPSTASQSNIFKNSFSTLIDQFAIKSQHKLPGASRLDQIETVKNERKIVDNTKPSAKSERELENHEETNQKLNMISQFAKQIDALNDKTNRKEKSAVNENQNSKKTKKKLQHLMRKKEKAMLDCAGCREASCNELACSISSALPLDQQLPMCLRGTPEEQLNLASLFNTLIHHKKCRRTRTVFTDMQLIGLEKRFENQKYLSTPDRIQLAESLGLSQLQVKTWYQNRRMKWKKKVLKDGCLDPPTKPKGRPKKNSIPSFSEIIQAAEAENNKNNKSLGSSSGSGFSTCELKNNSMSDDDEEEDDDDDDDDDDDLSMANSSMNDDSYSTSNGEEVDDGDSNIYIDDNEEDINEKHKINVENQLKKFLMANYQNDSKTFKLNLSMLNESNNKKEQSNNMDSAHDCSRV